MKKTLLTILLSSTILFSNQIVEQNNSTIGENVLEYEKVLKRLQEKKDYEEAIRLEKAKILEESNIVVQPMDPVNFNVIGTISVDGKGYAYLLTKENKVLKTNIGMVIDGNIIKSITSYGINIEKKEHTAFLPIITNQIQEIDVIFSNGNNRVGSDNQSDMNH